MVRENGYVVSIFQKFRIVWFGRKRDVFVRMVLVMSSFLCILYTDFWFCLGLGEERVEFYCLVKVFYFRFREEEGGLGILCLRQVGSIFYWVVMVVGVGLFNIWIIEIYFFFSIRVQLLGLFVFREGFVGCFGKFCLVNLVFIILFWKCFWY